jgi:hypothetical protein
MLLTAGAGGPLVLVGGRCALLTAVVLRGAPHAPRVLVFEPPERPGGSSVSVLTPHALELLARVAPDVAAALHARGVAALGADAPALCVSAAALRRTLLDALPPASHVAGMQLTGLVQARTRPRQRLRRAPCHSRNLERRYS